MSGAGPSLRNRVTKALAELDLVFSIGTNQQRDVWSLTFRDAKHEETRVTVHAEGAWLIVAHIGAPAPEGVLGDLLKVNARLALAKIALISGGRAAILCELPVEDVSAERLKSAFGAVHTGAAEVRKLLASRGKRH